MRRLFPTVWLFVATPFALAEESRPLAFNRDIKLTVANFSVAMAGWPAGTSADLYDLWAHAPLGRVTDAWSAEVQPHDVLMVRATRVA